MTNSPTRSLLVIDDDEAFRTSLSEQLQVSEGYSVVQVGTAAAGLSLAVATHYDAILLDIGLPDIDGLQVCKLVRRHGVRAPVIILSADASDANVILGLEAGANDYVTKPFNIGILLARLRSHLRRYDYSEHVVMPIGSYDFYPARKIIVKKRGGKRIRLTHKEAEILKYLFRAGEQVVTRDEMLREVWGYTSGLATHTLETHIYRLR